MAIGTLQCPAHIAAALPACYQWRPSNDLAVGARGTAPAGEMVKGSLVMGVPGKVRKRLSEADQGTILRYARNYLGYKDNYLAERKNSG